MGDGSCLACILEIGQTVSDEKAFNDSMIIYMHIAMRAEAGEVAHNPLK